MSGDCIFCKILKGEIPSARVYEDGDVLAFMDIGPVTKGHTLVIPRQHYNPLMNTPDDVLGKVMAVVRKVAAAQTAALGADGINVSQANGEAAGQIVPHIHFHVIPRHKDDSGIHHWKSGRYESPAEMEEYAAKLRKALSEI